MASSSRSLPCPAWVWSVKSNVHVAKDRSWFGEDYTLLDSFVYVTHNPSAKLRVVGIGSVRIRTKTSPHQFGPSSHGTLVLRRVLHVPSSLCNVIGHDPEGNYKATKTQGPDNIAIITGKTDDQPVGYFKNDKTLRLSGPPVGPKVGPSPFKPSRKYIIYAEWPESERQRLLPSKAFNPSTNASMGSLTPSEKAWIKQHYKNELKFLRCYGLSISKDEDRDKGLKILRTLMSDKKDEKPTMNHNSVGVKDPVDAHEPRNLDSLFSSRELDWINRNHISPAVFMRRFYLDSDKPEDCKTAQNIVRHYMPTQNEDTQTANNIRAMMNLTGIQIERSKDIQAMFAELLAEKGKPNKSKMNDILHAMVENFSDLSETMRIMVRTTTEGAEIEGFQKG